MDEYSSLGIFDTDVFLETEKQPGAVRIMVPQHSKSTPKHGEHTSEADLEQHALGDCFPAQEVDLITGHLTHCKSNSVRLEELSQWPFPVFTLSSVAESRPPTPQQNVHAGKHERSSAPNSKTQLTMLAPGHDAAAELVTTNGRREMIVNGLPLVKAIARSITFEFPLQVDLGDLVQAGTLALKSAVEKYDPQKVASFSTYVKCRIRGAMLDSLRAFDLALRVAPPTQSNLNGNPRLRLSFATGPE